MITIRCPENEVYGGLKRMKHTTTLIAIVSVLVMIVSLLFVFRNLQKVIATEAGIENELKVASAIQMDMLPKLYPSFKARKDLDLYGFQKSAKSVGGDLYDFFIRDEKLFFCIGDVSGKGVPAALYMAVILSLFRNVGHSKDKPGEIMESINRTVSEGNTSNMFCTLFVGVLDLTDGHLEYCNGGHNPPLVKRSERGEIHYARIKVNVAIGVMAEYGYRGGSAELAPGDGLLLYTDGVSEAEDREQRLFGNDALKEAFARAAADSESGARGYVERIYESLTAHTAGAEQNDDITMLMVEYRGSLKQS